MWCKLRRVGASCAAQAMRCMQGGVSYAAKSMRRKQNVVQPSADAPGARDANEAPTGEHHAKPRLTQPI
eukprot:7089904-Pyramimonas_sp.AAC.1